MSALLDVSEILLDADLCDTVVVKRRAEVINNSGRSVVNSVLIPGVVGVVTSAGRNDLERLPEDQRMGRNLCFVTNFKLRGPAPGYQPDAILWHGNEFVVKQLDPYPQYGFGFVQAIIGSMDYIDAAILPNPPIVGKVDFSDASQSGLIQAGVM